YEDVQDEVGAKVYADLLQSITENEVEGLDEYAGHRFDRYLEEMRTFAMQDPKNFEKMQEESIWALNKRIQQLTEEEIVIGVGEFSPVSDGHFYQLMEKGEVVASEKEVAQIKEYLKYDAEQKLMRKLLKRM
ncbi:MAG: hypothetical protein K1000chlam3_00997, partial [Chlamydiae bacterium]|nr:hypothetical protein [Chlamydiota bacterium]